MLCLTDLKTASQMPNWPPPSFRQLWGQKELLTETKNVYVLFDPSVEVQILELSIVLNKIKSRRKDPNSCEQVPGKFTVHILKKLLTDKTWLSCLQTNSQDIFDAQVHSSQLPSAGSWGTLSCPPLQLEAGETPSGITGEAYG